MVNKASSKQEKTYFEKLTSKKRHKGEDYVTSPFSEIIQLKAMTIKKKVMSKPLVMTIKRRLRRVWRSMIRTKFRGWYEQLIVILLFV